VKEENKDNNSIPNRERAKIGNVFRAINAIYQSITEVFNLLKYIEQITTKR
jgi:hypothetical protein